MGRAHNFKDISGQKFNRLFVITYHSTIKKKAAWLCKCDCGKSVVVSGDALRSKKTRSCGCYSKDQTSKRRLAHGESRFGQTQEYTAWMSMRSRCYRVGDKFYPHYGGRGIKVCKRWLRSFENFLADMGRCPKGHSIDRRDNDGDYTPKNTRWATPRQQANNRRTNRIVTFQGISDTLANTCRRVGAKYQTVTCRLYMGWSLDDAITRPHRLTHEPV